MELKPIGKFTKKQSPIGSVITEILSFRKNNRQTVIVLLWLIDKPEFHILNVYLVPSLVMMLITPLS